MRVRCQIEMEQDRWDKERGRVVVLEAACRRPGSAVAAAVVGASVVAAQVAAVAGAAAGAGLPGPSLSAPSRRRPRSR